jgi:hypothetical protein
MFAPCRPRTIPSKADTSIPHTAPNATTPVSMSILSLQQPARFDKPRTEAPQVHPSRLSLLLPPTARTPREEPPCACAFVGSRARP